MKLEQFVESQCNCDKCNIMCTRPCWGTPNEIKKLIDKGYGHLLMLDCWVSDDVDFDILCPALKEFEAIRAPFLPMNAEGCIFWKNLKCILHDLGLKPIEGRLAIHNSPHHGDIHELVAETWNNEEGRAVIKEWKEKYEKSS